MADTGMIRSAYPIPAAALDDRLGWIGTSGSGKTYNASAGVERLLGAGARVVIVDPLDVWWGLRLQPDGSPSRHNVVIFGGEHGDLPLNEGAGALIGETVAGMAESCIVSLGGLNTKASERRFMLAFLDAIYRHTDARRADPYHIVFDEADLWAPQKSSEPMLQSRMEEIVRRGRIKGFIPWLITQRPAVLSKDVLSQVDGLIAFKLTSSQDRDAIGAWIEGQADRAQGREILASLPTMQRGEGVVWVPGRGILETAAFPVKQTFDSSRTPRRGERREHRDLKPLDLAQLKQRLSSVEDEAKASDPKALKTEIARLARELARAEKAKVAAPPPQIVHANAEEIARARDEGEAAGYARGIQVAAQAIAALGGKPTKARVAAVAPAAFQKVEAEPMAVTVADGLSGPQQRILNALAWWKAFGIERPTNEQVAFIAGYSPTSGGYANPRGALRAIGFIEYPAPNMLSLTETGEDKAEAPDAAPTVEEMHRRIMGKLSGPQQRIFGPVLESHPDPLSNEELAGKAGYSPTSGGYANPRGSLKSLNLIEYPSPGYVRACDWLFP